jgi:hypothetical protein
MVSPAQKNGLCPADWRTASMHTPAQDMEDNMKKLSLICWAATSLLATQVFAGSLTVNGDLTVTTNLTAESISLGGVTQTNWPSALAEGYQGYKYVIVAEGTNDLERGSNLQTAYATATTLDPTSSNRVVVLVPPGSYNLSSTGLVMNTSYVDLIGLVPAQMTSKQVFTDSSGTQRAETIANVNCPVLIYASAGAGTLVQNVDYVRIESLILSNTSSGFAYDPSLNGTNTVLRHVSMTSMGTSIGYPGLYVDCISGGSGFTGDSGGEDASGTFIDCVGSDYSFGVNASGTFIGCTGGGSSFGGNGNTASGTFVDCVGGGGSFGSGGGTASGSFNGCVGGYESFANSGEANGTFIDSVGGDYSFGANDPYNTGGSDADGTFIDCVGGAGSFGSSNGGDGGSLDNTAKLRHCQGGSGSFGSFNMASQDFNYNVGGTNTFLMLPQLPTPASTNGLPSGTVYNSSGSLKVMP